MPAFEHCSVGSEIRSVFERIASYLLTYAQNGNSAEAYAAIHQARELFPAHFGIVPCFVSVDYNQSQLIIFEALTYLNLGTYDQKNYHKAVTALAAVDQIPESSIPQRSRVELLNYQTQAAIGVGDFDAFEQHLLASIHDAHALGSQKRQEEIYTNWLLAKEVWPHEHRMRLLERHI